MTGETLRCHGVCKGFGAGRTRTEVLKDLSFAAEPGRVTAILGPSGSGKSTLLSILAGILEPDAGVVSLGETNLFSLSRARRMGLCGRRIGVVPQRDHLIPSLSVGENAALGLIAMRLIRREALLRAERALDALGLEGKARLKPTELSIGQRQRVALARALAPEPSVLLCDEPTAALDELSSHAAMSLLREGAQQSDRAVLLVTHDESLLRPEDAVYRLSAGGLARQSKLKAGEERSFSAAGSGSEGEAA